MSSEDGRPLRVGIVDDHQFMRMGIEHHFANVPDVEVALSVGDYDELPPAGSAPPPDLLLLDLRLQGGRTTLPVVAQWSAHIPVLMMSVSGDEQDVIASLRQGARGYITKHAVPEDFLEAVRTVGAGGFFLSRDLADVVLRLTGPDGVPPPEEPQTPITKREMEVLQGIANGLTHRQVARRLAVKESTVDEYVKRIRLKRKLGNKADLVRLAAELGLLEIGP